MIKAIKMKYEQGKMSFSCCSLLSKYKTYCTRCKEKSCTRTKYTALNLVQELWEVYKWMETKNLML